MKTYLAALSYSSNKGIANSFIFFGTASTSESSLTFARIDQPKTLTPLRHLHQEQLLTLLRFRDMCWHERIHERFKIGSPPLCKTIANFPFIIQPMTRVELATRCRRCQSGVQSGFEPRRFVFTWFEVVSW